ncbi:glycosyltransferase [uncultured Jannaschia sp.]|uniref:glycosyltransferase n=1 Tax=uncultured Jannaschia sp. TaxID=293347 RepID=UPI002623122F|nr:glycosyltransferase [uncultured Jannaschia sp.]
MPLTADFTPIRHEERSIARPPPDVLIVMATRDGAAHLPAQLASLEAQSHKGWRLWVGDDGSRDGTRAILEDFAGRMGGPDRVNIVEGPHCGASGNFLTQLGHPSLPLGPRTHVALCDQDDVWYPSKLTRAIDGLQGTRGPALYGAGWRVVDADGRATGGAIRRAAATDLPSLMAQNAVSGHTAMLNPALVTALRAGPCPRREVPFHDWWLAQFTRAIGGEIRLDRWAVLDYRQHDANVLGAPGGLAAGAARLRRLVDGTFGGWLAANCAALLDRDAQLTPEARHMFERLRADPTAATLRRLGIRRSSGIETAALRLAARAGRLGRYTSAPAKNGIHAPSTASRHSSARP